MWIVEQLVRPPDRSETYAGEVAHAADLRARAAGEYAGERWEQPVARVDTEAVCRKSRHPGESCQLEGIAECAPLRIGHNGDEDALAVACVEDVEDAPTG